MADTGASNGYIDEPEFARTAGTGTLMQVALEVLSDGKPRNAHQIVREATARGLGNWASGYHNLYIVLRNYYHNMVAQDREPLVVHDQVTRTFRINRAGDDWPAVQLPPRPRYTALDAIQQMEKRLRATATGKDPAAFEQTVCDAFAMLAIRSHRPMERSGAFEHVDTRTPIWHNENRLAAYKPWHSVRANVRNENAIRTGRGCVRSALMTADEAAALLRPVPGYTGSCAHSPLGVDDDVPVGRGEFQNIVAIGKLVGERGTIVGWIYKTEGKRLLIQRVAPPLEPGRFATAPHTYSGVDPLRPGHVGTVLP
jgi:hypothetical protein